MSDTTPTTDEGLAPDEKRCPYCAETIKAAAIRCRFCHSDLASAEPAADTAPAVDLEKSAPADRQPDRQPDPEPDREPDLVVPGAGTTTSSRAVAALLVLCLVLAGGLWYLVDRSRHPELDTAPNGQVTQSSFRNAAMSAASSAATQAFSYSYKTFDEDRKKTEALLVPGSKAAKEYDAAMKAVAEQTASAKITQKAVVLAAGAISVKEHAATMLLFVNTVTTREGSKNQQLNQSRVRMKLTREDGDWTVTEMAPV